MKYTREVVQAFLEMKDRSVEEKYWELINEIVTSNNDIISDNEKLIMIRKPKNIINYFSGSTNRKPYTQIRIDGYTKSILH